MDKKILRIIDANVNRIMEGLRVVEEIMRFVYNEEKIYLQLRQLRHKVKKTFVDFYSSMVNVRDSVTDPGRVAEEKKYKNIKQVVISNLRRCTESLRVLEELFKLVDIKKVLLIKKMRYKLYDLEKHVVEKIL